MHYYIWYQKTYCVRGGSEYSSWKPHLTISTTQSAHRFRWERFTLQIALFHTTIWYVKERNEPIDLLEISMITNMQTRISRDAIRTLQWKTDLESLATHNSYRDLWICTLLLIVLQPFRWRCAECAVHHEQNVREEQHHIYVARRSNNRVIAARDLYCYLLPQCEALRTFRSGFLIATIVY